MAKNKITIKLSVLISKPIELVWDYTQNYENRTDWDNSVIEATVLQTTPNRIVRLKTKGKTSIVFIYKLDERPHRTTLVAKEVKSPLIFGGGGSWRYEEHNDKTLWTQTNTIILKQNHLLTLLLPIFKLVFRWMTKKAMMKAKKQIEKF